MLKLGFGDDSKVVIETIEKKVVNWDCDGRGSIIEDEIGSSSSDGPNLMKWCRESKKKHDS